MGADLQLDDVSIRDSYTDYCADASVEGCWRFDPAQDKLLDISGNDHHGTLTGSPTYGAGKVGNSYDYSGTDQYIDVGRINMANWTGIAFCAWVYSPADGAAEHTIISNYFTGATLASMLLRIEPSDNTIEGFIVVDSNTLVGGTFSDLVLTANTWHHVACSYDKTDFRCYLDSEVSSTTYAETDNMDNLNSTNTFQIANSPHDGNDDFTGKIDEVGLWSRALTATEIADIYRFGLR